jgi:hypothetical protein
VAPDAPAWDIVEERLTKAGVTPAQVQVAWVKQTRVGIGAFPTQAITIEGDLEEIARNLLTHYPNIKLAYYSSRTRAYTYWSGLSPEPAAFENGFSVKWMIQKQINGDPALNFAPPGAVVAPFLTWGPYLWADGPNPRSDGFTWLQEDLEKDCTHPSPAGELKVANLLMDFFTTDSTARCWFLDDGFLYDCHRLVMPALHSNPIVQASAVYCAPWMVVIKECGRAPAFFSLANSFPVIPRPESPPSLSAWLELPVGLR